MPTHGHDAVLNTLNCEERPMRQSRTCLHWYETRKSVAIDYRSVRIYVLRCL